MIFSLMIFAIRQDLIRKYAPENIYNANEFGLFFLTFARQIFSS